MARRTVARSQPATRVTKVKYPVYHAHGCLECGGRYADTCTTPEANGVCLSCRTGQSLSLERRGRLPAACCRTPGRCRLVTDVETLSKYGLAGPGPWYICDRVKGGCSRTHPFDPMNREDEEKES